MMRSDSLTLVSIFLSIVDDIERRTVYVERLLQIAVHAAAGMISSEKRRQISSDGALN